MKLGVCRCYVCLVLACYSTCLRQSEKSRSFDCSVADRSMTVEVLISLVFLELLEIIFTDCRCLSFPDKKL